MSFMSVPYVVVGIILSLAVCANAASAKNSGSCRPCHADFKGKLGERHPAVKVDSIGNCLPCHKANAKKQAGKNPFSTRIHTPHATAQSGVECKLCHEIKPGARFAVKGSKQDIGKPADEDLEATTRIMAGMSGATFMASGHYAQGVPCSGCHGAGFPAIGDTVENDKCLACHGSYDKLAETTKPKTAYEPNPHRSHLGDIACTACHYGHQKSVLYCKDCHPKFTITIPFGK
ncbi:Mcc [Geobacter sulfurreducens]|nr:Mcc [Geobacter sulfurreducens]